MPQYETKARIRQLAITSNTWTNIVDPGDGSVLPYNCNLIVIYNPTSVVINLRTDPGNANSQLPGGIPPGGSYDLGVAGGRGWRYPKGCPPAGSLQAASGSPVVCIESLE